MTFEAAGRCAWVAGVLGGVWVAACWLLHPVLVLEYEYTVVAKRPYEGKLY
jgi:hypothetical protein